MSLREKSGSDVLITGWGHTPFGRLDDSDLEDLVVDAAGQAISHAGIEPRDVDAIFFGQFNSGLTPLAFASSLALQLPGFHAGVPATRVENACASGSASFQQGVTALLAGTARTVLVIGAEKMTHAAPEVIGAALLGADYDMAGQNSSTGFTQLFADVAAAYEREFGPVGDTLARIAAKNHRNGVDNPYAHLRKDLGEEFCRTVSDRNPMVVAPLRRTDCSPVSDGAAAIVLQSDASDQAATRPVRLTGFAHANDFLPSTRRDPLAMTATRAAIDRAYAMAEIDVDGLDFAEVHDCFTIAELMLYEAIGLTGRGEGARAIDEGWVYPDGRLPVNRSGGLKAKGHPVGATGVSQHVIAAMQLTGTAGAMQLAAPRRGLVQNMGGVAIANYASVLEAVE